LSEVRIPRALLVTALSVVSLAWVSRAGVAQHQAPGLYGDLAVDALALQFHDESAPR